ncbi:hypothetical protein BGZ65_010214 [Modicella reniformis]|uniref:Uncharacterized protein n=1 Tax=Modicella reniformis TaxID=1440133 RepID=A0A9P6JIU2_9FUNG|nr:hypothetical protein BGZ65_010214 [Modicella reniformis]
MIPLRVPYAVWTSKDFNQELNIQNFVKGKQTPLQLEQQAEYSTTHAFKDCLKFHDLKVQHTEN